MKRRRAGAPWCVPAGRAPAEARRLRGRNQDAGKEYVYLLNPGAFGIVVNVMRGSARVAGYDWIAREILPAAQISVAPYTPRLIEIAP